MSKYEDNSNSRLRIGILASGTGSNFDAIAEAIDSGRVDADISVLLCNRPEAKVLDKAKARGVCVEILRHGDFDTRESFDAALADILDHAEVGLVVLAGFDRIISATLLRRFPNRVINIHPALLPAFKGTDAQGQAAAYGVAIAGATVHFVDEDVDHGAIIIQAAVPVAPGEAANSVRQRILAQEHRIYPYAVQLFAEGRLSIVGRKVIVKGRKSPGDEAVISPPLPD